MDTHNHPPLPPAPPPCCLDYIWDPGKLLSTALSGSSKSPLGHVTPLGPPLPYPNEVGS